MASRLSIFKQMNVAVGLYSNNSHQCYTRLCFVWHVFVLTTFVSSTKMWNLKLRIAVVGTDYQIITSDNICIGRINQSKTFLEKDLSHFSQRRGQGNIIIL